jgi:hypothetical protein
MKKTKSWVDSLDKALADCGVDKISQDHPGQDWFRLCDFMKETGMGETGARRTISKLLELGKIEKKLFKIRNAADQKIYPTPHYRFL